MKPQFTLLFLTLISLSLPLKSQSSKNMLVRGRVLDQYNNNPLPFANVVYGQKGTTTNLDGQFVLAVDTQDTDSKLVVKYIGYQSVTIGTFDQAEIIIKLKPSSTILESITVYSAEDIIQDVNNHHQINYEFEDLMLNTYYKETIKSSGQTNHIAEGVFRIYLPTIYSNEKTSVEVLKTRKKDLAGLDSKNIPLISGHASDMIDGSTRRQGSFLDPDHKNNYEFSKEDFTTYDDREVYILSFTPKNKKATAEGLIYIDSKSNAIIKTEYYPILKNQNFWTHVKWTEEYAEHEGTWCLQRVSYQGEWKNNNQNFSFEALLVVTDSDGVSKKPDLENELSDDAVFFEQASNFSDNFWDGYDYVKLTQEEKYSFANEIN